MSEISRKVFEELDSVGKAINKLNKSQNVRTLEERVDLLIIGMTKIEKAFNDLITFKEITAKYDARQVMRFDFDLCEYAEKYYRQGNYIIDIMISKKNSPIVDKLFMKKRIQFLDLTKKMMQISARWHIERYINVYEFDTPTENKAFPKRKPLLEECIFFADRMIATKMGIRFEDGIHPRTIIFAVQPNAGKSFVVNVFSNIALCLHKLYANTSGILRMSNNMSNALGFSVQCKSMIEDEKILLIYPEFKKYFSSGKCKILEKTISEEWKLSDLDPKIRASFFARGRDSAINSIRIFVALTIDDLSDGFDQMNNDEAHQDMTTKFEIDMDSRKESADVPTFIAGTMFNEFDVPNTIIRKLEEQHLLFEDKNFRNVRHTPDYSTVVIAVDCFDSKGRSVAPNLISTEKLKEKQEALKDYEFELVYRQIRASREPRVFDRGNLHQHSKLPSTLSNVAVGVLDPTRKSGNDYFALPLFRFNPSDNLYYFVNCIYEQKSLGKTSDPKNIFLEKVVNFLIENQVVNFTIENNTSNTIGTIIEEKLLSKGYTSCKINEIYTKKIKGGNSSKMQRILDQEATITRNISFPEAKMYPPLHPMTIFMEHFTRYDAKEMSTKKNHDDAPDSIAIFSQHHLFNMGNRYSTVAGISKKKIWR